jgi:hypothetical protein
VQVRPAHPASGHPDQQQAQREPVRVLENNRFLGRQTKRGSAVERLAITARGTSDAFMVRTLSEAAVTVAGWTVARVELVQHPEQCLRCHRGYQSYRLMPLSEHQHLGQQRLCPR